ncbi:hypothetical protein JRO89_XSUnG0175300 [Xanthoceras sorbifolium]|uniref:Uncharacterized protein n=1 Tax=Xanthoceras sorbifolium TaxID=99658 RepID=A0ABQ8GXL1_9ROSI|nr:hypothetical protein JRO89_XSUnG0175300 [Xanthoceras sorbifolium]
MGWKKIPRAEVEMLILRIREEFKLSVEPHVDMIIEEDMKRSYVRWEHINSNTGAFPDRIDTFKLTRYDEEINKWVDDDAKNAYDKMNSLHTNPPEELQHMSKNEIYDYVIGEFPSGCIRGLGVAPSLDPLLEWLHVDVHKLRQLKEELRKLRHNLHN